MALPVDSFELLVKDISSSYSKLLQFDVKSLTWKDWLAILGTLYATSKAINAAKNVYDFVKLYGIARYTRPQLVRKYGPWAVVTGSTHGIGRAYAQELASYGFNIAVVSLGREDCAKVANYLVVTGCTSGIGKALTLELAVHGFNIVLLSRSYSKLQEFATSIEKKFGVQACPIAVDFNDGEPIYDTIWDGIKDKEIGVLVNNVGVMYDYPQLFLEVPEEKLWQLVHVNVAAATLMTKLVLPQMVERDRGAIITVSSAASFIPTPQMTVYSATKSYLDFFIRGLQYEYLDSNITFQCLTPFYVATRMTQFSPTLSSPSLWIPSAAVYARNALLTLGWTDKTTGYWPHTLQEWVCNLVPVSWRFWFATRLNNGFRRQAMNRIRRRSGHISEFQSRSRSSSFSAAGRRRSSLTSLGGSPHRKTSITMSTSGVFMTPSEAAARKAHEDSSIRVSQSDGALAHHQHQS